MQCGDRILELELEINQLNCRSALKISVEYKILKPDQILSEYVPVALSLFVFI